MGAGSHWSCISGCGACCRLDPEQRGEALDALSEEQRQLYLSMVGADGWCRHFNTGSRTCRIYADRPEFCRVGALAQLFAIPLEQGEAFAIACCQQQIREEYGGRSVVMRRFERATRQPGGHPAAPIPSELQNQT
ncbi:YkgJ family cysteine cluster protein [Synechococcus sp. Cruz-9H2]|uniref:YkgJ family cysteine cluster protein n=1 Tax=unclassified Synechococcus TaxID=2626047 RepID=UPI0020CE6F15|nr:MULTISPECIES: YkgJ family cysteine cluster protein [unclassified Synechococcus]MCP9818454.1 YkgJ family cysteine cluster protein [Synechococcus sp. Cruz-9H2]MCP9842683.1 YkgJ family cysteine cluster protein [Synechococcus sp. Edmonson 11F2]MCP9855347.1 YkgJ family cysteine cluster protein [Synechococcus sp. Cruz-9C9]MCP9862406.1 YkgJ family cysteine cluster protein [Synechococcus sp. Cruz-7E5]MCP9869678.1 YkgJ family cysteine cluster protein [Synechococcus sp. Cruz-7B9]